jgi:hypothetical protein
MLSAALLSVVMLSVVAPIIHTVFDVSNGEKIIICVYSLFKTLAFLCLSQNCL